MIRELITRFNRSLSERMVAARRRVTVPVKVWFDPDINTEIARDIARSACLIGETVDISRTGVGFMVPAIRVKEKYLVGHERDLNIELDLPTGKIRLKAIGKRYEKVGTEVATERFLVGVHILNMTSVDREQYELFVRNGHRGPRRAAGQVENWASTK